MRFSLADLIEKRSAAGVAVGMSRDQVVATLGDPGLWEGHVTFPANESRVWRYGALQITFHDDEVSSITLLFETIDETTGATDKSSSELVDEGITSSTTIEEFERVLRLKGIKFERTSDATRQQVLHISDGVVAKFSRRTDYEQSASHGRPILSEHHFLVSIRVNERRLANTDA